MPNESPPQNTIGWTPPQPGTASPTGTEGLPTQWSPTPSGPAPQVAPDPAKYAPVAPMAPTEASPIDGAAPKLGDSDVISFLTRGLVRGADKP